MNDINYKNISEEEWKKRLSPEEYHILREQGTEMPGSGAFYLSHDKGTYLCGACGLPLFSSDTKFDSDCGWPSFDRSINTENVDLIPDDRFGMFRTEVRCKRCGSHLGHVFDDGPKDTTGKRYCINSLSLKFDPQK